jgi:hypothetical protein
MTACEQVRRHLLAVLGVSSGGLTQAQDNLLTGELIGILAQNLDRIAARLEPLEKLAATRKLLVKGSPQVSTAPIAPGAIVPFPSPQASYPEDLPGE